jgi:hypothetical protein
LRRGLLIVDRFRRTEEYTKLEQGECEELKHNQEIFACVKPLSDTKLGY